MGNVRERRFGIRRWRATAAAVVLLATALTVGSPAAQADSVPISRDEPTLGAPSQPVAVGAVSDAEGEWMVTGGPTNLASGIGRLLIYRYNSATAQYELFQEITKLEDKWGRAVGVHNDRILVGSEDGLTLYDFDGTTWVETLQRPTSRWVVDLDMNNDEVIIATASSGVGGTFVEIRESSDDFGAIVASLTIPNDNTQQTRVTLAPEAGPGDTFAAVGNPRVDNAGPSTDDGEVYLYKKSGGTWSPAVSETLSNPDGNTTSDRWFGSSLASDSDRLFVGHSFESDDNGVIAGDAGAVWEYEGTVGAWTGPDKIKSPNPSPSAAFGTAIAWEPATEILVVGEPGASFGGASFRGRVYTYLENPGAGNPWLLSEDVISAQTAGGDQFGSSVAVARSQVDGANFTTQVLIGAPGTDNPGAGLTDTGAAYIYRVAEPDAPANKLISPFNNQIFIPDFRYGADVALENGKLIVGAPDALGNNGFVFVYDDSGTNPKYPDDQDQLLRPTDSSSPVTNSNFGEHVAADGNLLAVGYGSANLVDIYELSGGVYAYRESVTTADPINAIDLSGNTLVVGSAARAEVQLWSFDIAGVGTEGPDNFELTGSGEIADVAVFDDLIAYSEVDTLGSSGINQVRLLRRNSALGVSPVVWAAGDLLTNPDANTAGDGNFGLSVAIDDTTLVVGHNDSDAAPFSGALWIYEKTGPGTVGTPVKIKEPVPDTSHGFGAYVAIDGDIIVTGNPGGQNGISGRSGEAHIVKRDPDNGIWSYDSIINPTDANTFDEFYGAAVAIEGGDIAIGAEWNDNQLGVQSGAVYYWDTAIPVSTVDNPVLTLTTGTAATSTSAGATGISVVDLPPTAIEGYGGSGSGNIVGTSLNAVEGADDAGANELLSATTLGDLGLEGDLLNTILLSDVVIDGGWDAALAGTLFAGLPLQNVTLAQALSTGNIDVNSLDTLDLSATPVGAIPVGAIALADTPVNNFPLPGGQSWCAFLLANSPTYNCTTTPSADPTQDSLVDLTVQGTPVGAIPVGAIPVGAIPVGAIPVGAIPVGAIDIAGTPVGAIPVGAIPVGAIPVGAIPVGAIPVGAIPVGAIPVGAIPVGAIPVGAINLGDITLGSLTANGGVAASPVGAIPVGAIPVGAIPVGAIPVGAIPVGAIPVGAIPVGAIDIAGTPVGAIPVGAIDIAGTPVGAIPVGAIPVGAIPVGAIPVGAIPVGAIPVGAIDIAGAPVGAIPVGAIPVGAIDLAASPVGAIPVGAIPVGAIGTFVDCALINCDPAAGFTLADAQAAGALLGATIADFQGLDTGVTIGDLVGVGGYSETDLRNQVDAATAGQTLSQLLTFDDMTLSDLPQNDFGNTTIGDLGAAAQALITLEDLLDATGGDEAALVAQLLVEVPTLADFVNYDGMVLADLPITEAAVANTTIEQILSLGATVRLGDILDYHPTLGGTNVDWGSATLADINDWQDVTLEELATYNGTTVAELILSLSAALQNELTFGDLLLAIVGTEAHDWSDVELDAIDLAASGSPINFTTQFKISGGSSPSYSMNLATTIPDGSVYVPGSATITADNDQLQPPIGSVEPTVEGNQMVWDFGFVRLGEVYDLTFDVAPSLSLGTNTVSTVGEISGFGVQSTGFDTIGVTQAFEPNDAIGDALPVVSDTIYASHIADADDVDLYRIDLQAGSRLATSLSDLPADFDLVVYGPPTQPVTDQPALRQLNPTEVPDQTLDPTENTNAEAVLQDVPLQDLPVVGVSNNRDTENESIDIASVRSTGTYYIQVSGYSGATSSDPYALYVKAVDPPAPLTCVAQDYQSSGNVGTLPSVASLAGVNTLILVNQERLHGKYGAAGATQTLNAVNNLVTYTNTTNPSLGVTAAVVPVDGDGAVRSAYAALDSASCEPDRANDVVREINRVIDDMRNADPNTEINHIMIVGDDDIIPMARLVDDTTIANESGYAQTFSDVNANSYFGALLNSFYLSDEPYGDLDPIQSGERILYVTDIALGRLVETPAEIEGQILAYIGFNGELDTDTALVTGYDFLDDGAAAVADALAALPDTGIPTELINETWTDDDLAGLLLPSAGTPPQIASINAHYDHYRILPADQSALGIEDDLFTTGDLPGVSTFGSGVLSGRSLHSMGCHGGLSVPDELFSSASDPRALDWAQAYARQGATWVGNTGYGYGETEGVELSERLMALYSANLDGSVTAGEALFYAKQTYLGTQQAQYGAFDEKVLQQATFYGIPFYQFNVTVTPPPAPLPPQPVTAPVPGAPLDLTTIQANPAFTQVTAADGAGTSFEASVPAGESFTTDRQATPYAPIQPTASFDVSYVDGNGELIQVAQGAIITALVTDDVINVNPDLALPIVDDSAVEVEPEVFDISTDPAVFVSTYETPEGPRQSVSTLLGTFTSDQANGDGTQRNFEEISLDVYYRDPADDADQVRPTIVEVESDIAGGVLTLDATVTDNADAAAGDNIIRVNALVVEDAGLGSEWTRVELVNTGGDRWSGSLVLTGTVIEYLVQAVDGSGNTALTTNKSRLYAEDTTTTPPPPPPGDLTVTASAPPTSGVYYSGSVTLNADAEGDPIDYQINDGPIVTAGTSAAVVLDPAVLGDGAHTVTFTALGGTVTETVLFDTTSPVVAIASPGDGTDYEAGTDVPMSFSCADAASGLVSCDGLLDGVAVNDGDLVPGLTVGSHTLSVSGTDGVGNSSSDSVTFTVTAPDTSAPIVTGAVPTPDGNAGWFVTSPVDITWTVSDDDPTVVAPPNTSASTEGTNSYQSDPVTDSAGNTAVGVFQVSIDTVDPTAEVLTPAAGALLNNTLVDIATECADDTSEIATCVVTLDGNPSGDGQVSLADGVYTLEVTATDVAGRTSTATSTFEVDTTAPVVTADPLTPDGDNGWFVNAPVTITWTATGGLTSPPPTSASDEGTNDYQSAEVCDAAGNCATGTVTVSIDTNNPTASVVSPADGASLNDGLVDIMTSCTDVLPGSDVASCEATLNGGPVTDGQTSLADGAYTLAVVATDAAGNTASTSITFQVDTVAPEVTAEPFTPDGANGWFVSTPVVISWDAVDPAPSSGGVVDPADTTANTQGTNDFASDPVIDNAGNAATGMVSISIDTIAPNAAILSPADGAVFTDPLVDFATSCSDVVSGIDGCELTLNGNPAADGQTTVPDGVYTLTLTATDVAGNTTTTSIMFEVDTAAPVVSADPLNPDGANGWFITSPVNITWTATGGALADPPDTAAALEGTNDYESDPVSDSAGNTSTGLVSVSIDTIDPTATVLSPADGALLSSQTVNISTSCDDASPGSGVISCVVTVDGDSAADGPVTLVDGSHTIEVTATDEAGRTGTTSVTFTIDSTAPVVTAEPLAPDGDNGWFITNSVDVAWDAVDPAPSSGGVTDPANTTAGLEGTNDYQSDPVSDNAGNTGTGTVSVSIDTIDPTAAVLSPVAGALLGDSLVDIQTDCQDDATGSGIASCVVTVDGDPAADGPVTLADGTHTVAVTATDVAGRTATSSITFQIDSTAPVVTAEPLTPDGDNGWFITSPVTIAWDAVDPAPSLGGVTDPADTTAGLEGTNDYESDPVTDNAGNTGTGTVSVSIDTVDPVATVASPADGAILADSLVDVSTNCSDAGSGIASCAVTIDGSPVIDGQITLADGTYTLVVTATDVAGRTTSTTIGFEVDTFVMGEPLAIVSFGAEGASLIGETIDLSAVFTGDQDPHSVTIDWGDGTTCTAPGDPGCVLVEPTATDDGEVTATHVYATPDAYTVTMTITSASGEVAAETATVYACSIVGTNGNDWLIGTNGRDIICGLGGNDVIRGLRGNDVLVGGPGNDRIDGNNGHDIAFGNAGDDIINGHSGNDKLYGGTGDDLIRGSVGSDEMFGGAGNDRIYGASGNDTVNGNKGDDRIWGQSGSDLLRGGPGEDDLYGSSGNDTLVGGADDDYLDGSSGWDLLKGNTGNDFLRGGPQADILRGGNGTDTCQAGPGFSFFDVLIGCEL